MNNTEFGSFGGMTLTRATEPPAPFTAEPEGIYQTTVGPDGEAQIEWLCSPIRVLATVCTPDNTGWGKLIEVLDPHGNWHECVLSNVELENASKTRASLLDRGLKISGQKNAKEHVQTLLKGWMPSDHFTSVSRLGWTDGGHTTFVLGNGNLLGRDKATFVGALSPTASEMKVKGTLDQWRSAVAARCIGNPTLVAAVSAGFAGPLLAPLGHQGLGLHLRGHSSSGKSTALAVAISVWGTPRLMRTWRTTANALESVAAECNSTLLPLDEIGQVTGKDADEAAYTLGNGQGKLRANPSGRVSGALTWRVAVLSSGEVSLADKIAESGKKVMEGQEVRMIDVAADTRRYGVFDELHGAADAAAFSDLLRDNSAIFCGAAGFEFVRRLVRFHEDSWSRARRVFENLKADYARPLNGKMDGPAIRVCKAFALIGFAGELATEFGITGWKKGEAADAARELFNAWEDARAEGANLVVEQLARFLAQHGAERFESIGGTALSNRFGYRDENYFYVNDEAWQSIYGATASNAARALKTQNLIVWDGKHAKAKPPRWVENRPRHYKIPATICGRVPAGRSSQASSIDNVP